MTRDRVRFHVVHAHAQVFIADKRDEHGTGQISDWPNTILLTRGSGM
jgi:hypothetical protein